MTEPTRRDVLAGSALAAGTLTLPWPACAGAASGAAHAQAPAFYRHKIGNYEVTALYDGIWTRPVDDKFVTNVAWGEVKSTLTANYFPADQLPTPVTPLLVNTGSKLILLDSGTAGQISPTAGFLVSNLAAAGFAPADIDAVVISHFHPDHIDGIKTKDGENIFPRAEITVPAPEWAYWMDDANLGRAPDGLRTSFRNARRVFADIAKDVRRFAPGEELAPGITSIPAYGHTPGHSVFTVASGNQSMLYIADTTDHPWLFLRNPDWHGYFDMDADLAAEARKRLLDRAVADKMLVHGYHFPFPALGHIAKTTKGYDVVPMLWQPSL